MPKEHVNGVLSRERNWCLSAATEGEVTVQNLAKGSCFPGSLGAPPYGSWGHICMQFAYDNFFAAVGESSY